MTRSRSSCRPTGAPIVRAPIKRPAAFGCSARASAKARKAYNAGPGFGSRDFRSSNTGSRQTETPTVASGRVQLRRIASATPVRIALGFSAGCDWIELRKPSRSLIVTRPAVPVPAIPARSAWVNCNSAIRARTRGERYPAPFALAGTGNSPRCPASTLAATCGSSTSST